MKKKLIWTGAGVVVLLIVVAGVLAATFKMPEFIGMDGIEIESLEEKELTAVVHGKLYNPNFYSLGASDLEYIVTYHDTVLGRGALPNGLDLGGGDTTKMELPLVLELQAVFAVYKSMLREKICTIDIHLDGEFTSLHYSQGLDLQTDIDPDEFIQDVVGHSMGESPIAFEDFELKSMDLKATEIAFVSVVKNPLDVAMDLKQLNLALFADGSVSDTVGTWRLGAPVALKPEYSTRVSGNMKLKHAAVGKGIVDTIFKGELRYPCKGLLLLQLADLPFEIPIAGTVVFDPKTKKGKWEAIDN